MVPSMPPELRRKVRARYPVFGAADLTVRWLVPAGLVASLVLKSWLLAGVTVAVLVLAWLVRLRQFPNIVAGESLSSLPENSLPPPVPPQMEIYYKTWPLPHPRYGHPMVAEEALVWCLEHETWEAGEIRAWVSPGLLGDVNLNIELTYGDHSWTIEGESVSLVARGLGTYGGGTGVGRTGDLWEIRSRRGVDHARLDGSFYPMALAVLLLAGNDWDLVEDHLTSLGHWDGLEALEADLAVKMPE
jgi:hypothetical protein